MEAGQLVSCLRVAVRCGGTGVSLRFVISFSSSCSLVFAHGAAALDLSADRTDRRASILDYFSMSDIKATDPNEQVHEDEIVTEGQVEGDASQEGSETVQQNEENSMPSSQQEEEVIKKKYGGIIPKKPPLISKDHERAFFDSADWALGKQGVAKPKGPLEALRPKLQPTQQQVRSRRSAYASTETEEAGNVAPEELSNKE
ncbi:hypothetical protein J5N97_019618 [Dioscorea zingiberensis]|uniref:cAMP-regulated phosphoprotein 19-related protein n=1 Tax=Dioscorea zingiberensis TaxID=325984 RepID=A0A9D5HCN1_9LILI|nr:hypothetical protein J5N97_019618 [Dioscorea zingiberensis]